MPDLIFGTVGQAQALAAQEAVAAKARAIRAEFKGGSDALKQWEDPVKRIGDQVNKSFDPARIGRWVGSFVGVGAAINVLQSELADLQVQADRIANRQEKAYADALKSGNKDLAAQLSPRIATSAALEKGAQNSAVRQGTDKLGAEDLKRLDELMANEMGLGWSMRKLRMGMLRGVDGVITRDEAASFIQGEISMRTGDGKWDDRNPESTKILRDVLTELRAINNKDGGIVTSGE